MKEVIPIKKSIQYRKKEILRKHRENRNSQDIDPKVLQKPLPLRLKNRIESVDKHYGVSKQNLEDSGIDITDSDIEDKILQDPQKRKLMVWLLPQMKNEMKAKKHLKEAIKNKRITKQDLMDIISKTKASTSIDAFFSKRNTENYRYEEYSNNDNNYLNGSQNVSKSNLKIMTIKDDFNSKKHSLRFERNGGSYRDFSKSSKSPTKTLNQDFTYPSTINSTKPLKKNKSNRNKSKNANVISESSTTHNDSYIGTNAVQERHNRGIKSNMGNSHIPFEESTTNKYLQHRPTQDGQKLGEGDSGGYSLTNGVKLPEISKFSLMKKKAQEQFENFKTFEANTGDQIGTYFNATRK